ncbi:MAG: GNAT family N-acetyltransferase [Pseudomonadota bacterium]
MTLTRATDRPLTLSGLQPGDGPAITRLVWSLHQANREPIKPHEARALLRHRLRRGDRIAVARMAGRAVGYALWREAERHVYVRHFVVDPALARRGIGRRFFAALTDQWPVGRTVRLHCQTKKALAFWHALGFGAAHDPLHGDHLERRA